jgi:hypothetical protein
MRLRTDIFVSALLRLSQAEGAFVTVVRKGAAEAGTLFVVVKGRHDAFDLYGPAPQTSFSGARPSERLFSPMLRASREVDIWRRLEQEMRFDPDLWIVEIDDPDGRPFVDLAPDSGQLPPFTRG